MKLSAFAELFFLGSNPCSSKECREDTGPPWVAESKLCSGRKRLAFQQLIKCVRHDVGPGVEPECQDEVEDRKYRKIRLVPNGQQSPDHA